ncbi:DUF4249 domain-containing protein [Dyadobacter fermentans]|jgi:hypothetical protein|uniref:DUF4249 domain-containing protein n=1 Tax=Dyadobacter fermentans TaxID=94254 RepID=UPI001CBF585B|nr:DUF4249 domain-containing protein [Dyadobacter fermentans]MBZ1359032.1 DUF4249 domain-containing protein [Dyadobacter fermentans]
MFPRYIIFLIVTLFLAACESLVTDVDKGDLPQVESKLVVQCFISPQSARINVVVTESVPLFAEPDLKGGVIPNAVVKLSDGTRETVIPFDTANQLYSADKSALAILPGKTYFLSVVNGIRSVNATCTVPAIAVVPATYKIDTSYSGSISARDTLLTVKYNWNDIPGQTNYYRVRAALDLEYSIPEELSNSGQFKEKRVRNRFNFNWDDTIGRNDFRSDVNLDGTEFSSPIGRVNLPDPLSYTSNGAVYTSYPKSKIISITMEVYNTDEHYFKYHRSVQTRGDSDNPFVEPSLIYTNVEGGLGCFGAYNSGQLVYRPK